MDEYMFFKTPKHLTRAKGYFSPKDGNPIRLTHTEKAIYVYMVDRFNFFVKRGVRELFESQQTIAEACGMEYKAVGKVLRAFIDNGVMVAKKGKDAGSAHNRYYYTKIETDLTYWTGDIDNPTKIDNNQYKIRKEEKLIGVGGVVDDAPPWYGEDEPF